MKIDEQKIPEFARIAEVSRALKMSRGAVYDGLRRGSIPGIKIGDHWRIPLAGLERLVDQAMKRRIGATDQSTDVDKVHI